MYTPNPGSRRLPQRVVLTGSPGPALDAVLDRAKAALDLPLIDLAGLTDPSEIQELADFDGWIGFATEGSRVAALLDRADLAVLVLPEDPASLRGRVRRTVRRIRADGSEPDLTWFDALAESHPDLSLERLVGVEAIEAWLAAIN